MNTFTNDFMWQTKFYPLVKSILIQNAMKLVDIKIADDNADMKHATDFVVSVKGGTVAVRIRRNVANAYRDITIRSKRQNGVETELQKIKKGFADYYLYIWTNNNCVLDWWLIDVNQMRSSGILDMPRKEIWNKDGSSAFIAIPREELGSALMATYSRKEQR